MRDRGLAGLGPWGSPKSSTGHSCQLMMSPTSWLSRASSWGSPPRKTSTRAIRRARLGHPMGPFALSGLRGLDPRIHCDAMSQEYRESTYAPPPLLKRMCLPGLAMEHDRPGILRSPLGGTVRAARVSALEIHPYPVRMAAGRGLVLSAAAAPSCRDPNPRVEWKHEIGRQWGTW